MSSFNLGTASGNIVINGDGASQGFNVAQSAANAFFQAIENKVGRVEALGDRLTKVGISGVAGFGVAVKAASGFQAQMSAVEAVSGATGKEMDSLSKKALQLGKDTSFSATEAGSAMEELVKAGLSVDDVLNGAADATVALAAAGGVSLPEAATIASNAMNQFELSARDLPKVADLIAGAANASAIDVGDFGFSLSQAGAVAHLTGLSFDDLAVAIAEMGNAGIKGSDAGTSIKTFLTNLIPTTDQQTAKFQELGLYTIDLGSHMQDLAKKGIKPASDSFDDINAAFQQYIEDSGGAEVGTAKNNKAALELAQSMGVMQNSFFDANGKLKSFAEVQQILQNATKDLTQEQKLSTLETLFGSDAIRAAAVFAKEGASGYTEMATAMGKVKAADVAATRLNNLKGAVEQLKGSWETAMITIGNIFLPLVNKLVLGITSIINGFNNLSPGVQRFIGIFLGVGSIMSLVIGLAIKLAFVLGPLLLRFLGFAALRSVFSIFTAGFAAMRAGAGVFGVLSVMGGRAVVVFGRMGRAIASFITWGGRFIVMARAMGGAWSLIFGPIGLIVLAVIALGVILYKTFDPFKELVDKVARAIKEGLLAALQELKDEFGQIVAGFKSGKAEGEGFYKVLQQIGVYARQTWEKLKELAAAFMEYVIPALKKVGEEFGGAVLSGGKRIAAVVQDELVPAFQHLWEEIQAHILPTLQSLWEKCKPILIIIAKLAAVVLGVLVLALIKLFQLIVTYVIPAILLVYTYIIKYAITAVLLFVVALIKLIAIIVEVVAWLIHKLAGAFNWVADKAKAAWEKISSTTVTAWDAVYAAVSSAMEKVWAFIEPIWNKIYSVVSTVMSAIWNVITTIWNIIYTVVSTVLLAIWAVVSGVWNLFEPLIISVMNLILAVIQLVWAIIVFVFNTTLMVIWELMKLVWTGIVETTKFFWDLIVAFFTTTWEVIKILFTASIEFIKTLVQGAWDFVTLVTTTLWNGIRDFFVAIWDFITSLFTTSTSAASKTVSSAWDGISSFTTSIFNGIKSFLSGVWNAIWSLIGDKVIAIKDSIVNAFSPLTNLVRGYFNSMKDAAKEKIDELLNLVKDIPGKIAGFFSNMGSLLYNAGREIIQGLINGISSMIDKVTSMLKSLTDKIPKVKGPPKKDRVLLEDNGKLIMEGLITGLNLGEKDLIAALRQLTAAIPGMVGTGYLTPGVSSAPTAAQSLGGGITGPTISTIINNPIAEKSSDSVAKRLRTLSSAGVL